MISLHVTQDIGALILQEADIVPHNPFGYKTFEYYVFCTKKVNLKKIWKALICVRGKYIVYIVVLIQ